MADIERCTSPEEIPHLEPLGDPHSVASSVRDFPPPTSETPDDSATPTTGLEKESVNRKHVFEQMMHTATAPLKLSLVLENKGNVARDHLASERTYLAYVRTSLACASAGVALVQLLTLSPSSPSTYGGIHLASWAQPLGATIVAFALAILALGVSRYFATQSALIRGYFPVARNSITAVTFVLVSLVVIVFSILIAGTNR